MKSATASQVLDAYTHIRIALQDLERARKTEPPAAVARRIAVAERHLYRAETEINATWGAAA